MLVECANMRNPAEAELVSTPEGRARYASAVANGHHDLAHLPVSISGVRIWMTSGESAQFQLCFDGAGLLVHAPSFVGERQDR